VFIATKLTKLEQEGYCRRAEVPSPQIGVISNTSFKLVL